MTNKSLQVCPCGWSKWTTYRGLRIHQGRMGCRLEISHPLHDPAGGGSSSDDSLEEDEDSGEDDRKASEEEREEEDDIIMADRRIPLEKEERTSEIQISPPLNDSASSGSSSDDNWEPRGTIKNKKEKVGKGFFQFNHKKKKKERTPKLKKSKDTKQRSRSSREPTEEERGPSDHQCETYSDPLGRRAEATDCPEGSLSATATVTGNPNLQGFNGCAPPSECLDPGPRKHSIALDPDPIRKVVKCCNQLNPNPKFLPNHQCETYSDPDDPLGRRVETVDCLGGSLSATATITDFQTSPQPPVITCGGDFSSCRRELNFSTEDQQVSSKASLDESTTSCFVSAERKRTPTVSDMKPSLPTIITGNVRSILNKMDELTALTWCQKEYQECSLMLFSEMWLKADIIVGVEGFRLIRGDGSLDMGKGRGGGVAAFVNNRWCHPEKITVCERLCNSDIELLAISMHPYCLPEEFSEVIVVVVYIPPSADASSACEALRSTVSRLKRKDPEALLLIAGDFNKAADFTLPTFKQYVNFLTRGDKTLDLFYANIAEAYTASPLPPLGGSNHDLVYLLPVNKSEVDREPAASHTRKICSEDMVEKLTECFDRVWDVFRQDHGEDVDSFINCITVNINLCVDSTKPAKIVRLLVNSKPWITNGIKTLLEEKRRVFISGDREQMKKVQERLITEIKKGKSRKRELKEDAEKSSSRRLSVVSGGV
ncbi:uncharacterized protein LOC115384424 isoform X2 [Salarias fasciatus]|uniref:uncharacterized protein LOC115384424 isoform X2 n=1 Tax=Salarias fasciatus TaxID=181472 RepID=UPI00117674F5|nr:uncharacterized protein LOC115384424 isoform X2 [Salarias fasciatus]